MDDGRADLAVHSLKDVPMDLPDGFALAAVIEREDPRDALRLQPLSRRCADLPQARVVGTSSLRREAQLRERFPLAADAAVARQRRHAAAQAR